MAELGSKQFVGHRKPLLFQEHPLHRRPWQKEEKSLVALDSTIIEVPTPTKICINSLKCWTTTEQPIHHLSLQVVCSTLSSWFKLLQGPSWSHYPEKDYIFLHFAKHIFNSQVDLQNSPNEDLKCHGPDVMELGTCGILSPFNGKNASLKTIRTYVGTSKKELKARETLRCVGCVDTLAC